MGVSNGGIKIASAAINVVGQPDTASLLATAVREVLGAARVDLCVLFASPHFDGELESIALELEERLAPRAFIGCTGEAVISGEFEYEGQPAVSIWAAHLPGAQLNAFHIAEDQLESLTDEEAMHDLLGASPAHKPHFLLLGEPFSFGAGIQFLLERLWEEFPGRPAFGGMASAAEEPNQNALIFEGQIMRQGLVGVTLSGNVRVDPVVSQGCRPIGRHFVITKAEDNVVHQLGGRPPYMVVNDMLNECPARDRELARTRGLLVGRVLDEHKGSFRHGDFLIRNPIGFDHKTGAMAVNEIVRPGQTIQFHVRDAQSAADDLRRLLAHERGHATDGALLFSCNGRGTRLFTDRNHDALEVRAATRAAPLAGFFCAGEIGMIAGRSFLHGHTASIALFRDPQSVRDERG
ncbi:MAG: FIST N-terminal domain-containing protein [Phycisphaerae bacterium]